MSWEFNVDKANQLLDAAGWKRGADGIRAKDGKRLKMLYQTSINAPRQKTQADRQAGGGQGRASRSSSSRSWPRCSSPPTPPTPTPIPHFYADLQMYNDDHDAPDPQYFMNQFVSWEVASARPTSGRAAT